MENVKLINEEVENLREYSSGKRIKVSSSKLAELKTKFAKVPRKVEVEEVALAEPVVSNVEMEKTVDESFFGPIHETTKPVNRETRTYEEVRKSLERQPYSFEKPKEEVPVYTAPVKEEKEEKSSTLKTNEYTVPSIKSSTNVGDRSLKIRKMSESVDPASVVGKVLINGVSKLDANKDEIAKIKLNIERLEKNISDLEKQKEVVSGGKQDIEEILSKTATVSLAEIREAAKLDSSERAKRELDKIKASIDELQRIKTEEENKLEGLEQEKTRLEQERAQQKTRLMSAERNGIEICDTIERDLTTAGQIEKLEQEKATLERQLSLTKVEEPKKPIGIVNPFDKMRMFEEEAKDNYRRTA